jgi:hypothetical protein
LGIHDAGRAEAVPMTPEQQKALALARARRRRQEAQGQPQQEGGWTDTIKDVAASGASGIARGAANLAGLPGTLSDLMKSGGTWATRSAYKAVTGEEPKPGTFFGGPDPEIAAKVGAYSPLSGGKIQGAMSAVTGGATDYQPQTTAGEYASTVGEFLPGAAAFGGVSPANLLRFGVAPGLASEGAGQMTEGTAYELYARVAGAIAAPIAISAAQRLVTPFRVSPERAAAADVLRSEGVRPTAGQFTGNRTLRAMESELGGGATANILDDQAAAFTDAAMRRAGGGGLATPENMTAMNDRISQGFRDISARNTLVSDPQIGAGIGRTLARYERVLPTEQRNIVQNLADDIIDRFNQGAGRMSGADYQTIRSRLTKAAHAARNSDTEFADALRGLRNTLDDGMSRSISPDDAAEWVRLRREYGNMKVLEKAATGAGENAALGSISPAKLRQAAVSGRSGQYARGEGDFDELARAGEAVLKPLPDSGTSTRLNARTLGGITGAGGAGAGALAGGPGGAIVGALMGSAAPFAAGRVLMSRPVQAYLANQLLGPTRLSDPRMAAVIEALIGQQSSAQDRAARLQGR